MSFGLVTGNLEPIGWGKMRALGVLSLFPEPLWGGFGSDFCSGDTGEPWRDRGELVRLAKQRWLRQVGPGGGLRVKKKKGKKNTRNQPSHHHLD